MAHEHLATARCVDRAASPVRTTDQDRVHGRLAVIQLIGGAGKAPLRWLQDAFRLPVFLHERDAHLSRARLHRNADLEARIRRVHVHFPRGIALRVPREALGRGHARAFAAHGEPLDEHAIEAHVNLVRFSHTHQIQIQLPLQHHLDAVLAVERKEIANRGAAARPEWQRLARPIVLDQRRGNLERVDDRIDRGIADGESTDCRGRGEVALQQGRRDRQDAGDIVEALVVRLVGQQERSTVDLECEQVADRVRILGPVQPVDRNPSRIGPGRTRRVECGLERGGRGAVGGLIRPRPSRRWHLTRAKFARDFFPRLRGIADVRDIHLVEQQPGGLQPRVVAGDAVLIEDRARGGRRRSSLSVQVTDAHCRQPEPDQEDGFLHAPHSLTQTRRMSTILHCTRSVPVYSVDC